MLINCKSKIFLKKFHPADRWRGKWTRTCGFWRPKTLITVHLRRYHRNRAVITPPRRLARKEVMSVHRRPRASSVPPITDWRRTSVLACIYYYYYYFHGFFIIAMSITGGLSMFAFPPPKTDNTEDTTLTSFLLIANCRRRRRRNAV